MELIKIYNGSLVDARELWNYLGSKRQFANWIKQRIQECDLIDNQDYFTFNKIVKRSKTTEYHLTIMAAKEVALIERNDKGKEIRRYFIKCEETLQVLKNSKRFQAFLKLETTKKRLQQNIEDIGGTYEDFVQIDLAGRKVLFNGEIIPDEELPTLTLKGRDFATEATNARTKGGGLSLDEINEINEINHKDVRDIVINNAGKKPEELPTEEKLNRLGE